MNLAFRLTQTPVSRPDLPASLAVNPQRSRWLGWVGDGTVEVRSGKVEIGQGILTALAQIAAHELHLPLNRIRMVPAQTGVSPDEAVTSGSLSIQESGTAIRIVCAEWRMRLVARAAARLGVAADTCEAHDGAVHAAGQRIDYSDLDPASLVEGEVDSATPAQALAHGPTGLSPIIGQSAPRRDLPGKLRGTPAYLHDLSLPGLMHGRVIRSALPGARLVAVDDRVLAPFGERVRLIRDGDFLAVASGREWLAIRAAERLNATTRWQHAELPFDDRSVAQWLCEQTTESRVIAERSPAVAQSTADEPAPALDATYTKPFIAHASLMPSCAIARWSGDRLEIWSHSQGPYNLRGDLALVFPSADIIVRHAEGAGCYGHNGADDVALDAALIARAIGAPVRVLWSRRDEMIRSPLGSAMTMRIRAWLDGSRITRWEHQVWSAGHGMRPGRAPTPTLLAATEIDSNRFEPREAVNAALAAGGGSERNAIPAYTIPNLKVVNHRVRHMPLRTSALRSLGAFGNVFAVESTIDDLAAMAGTDPIAFRLAHLEHPRARRVLETLSSRLAQQTGLNRSTARERRHARDTDTTVVSTAPVATTATTDTATAVGVGFAHYKNAGAWCAVAAEVEVSESVGVRRLIIVADLGRVINPDGARNQLEGGALQACSWALLETMRIDRQAGPVGTDWSTYPIMNFSMQPAVEIVLIDADHEPPLGAGECTHGPTAAAIGNAVYRALGLRVRHLPLTRERLIEAARA